MIAKITIDKAGSVTIPRLLRDRLRIGELGRAMRENYMDTTRETAELGFTSGRIYDAVQRRFTLGVLSTFG